MMTNPILVTGAAGRVSGVGGLVVEALLRRGQPVRALVRCEDERAEALRATGAEVVVAHLTRPADVGRTYCQPISAAFPKCESGQEAGPDEERIGGAQNAGVPPLVTPLLDAGGTAPSKARQLHNK